MSLIIFDCDGVLIDSEEMSMLVLREVASDAGVEIAEDVAYRRFLGRNMASIVGILRDEFGLSLSARQIDDIRARLRERFRRQLKPVRGIAAALDELETPYCVASSSQPERIRFNLGLTGLLARFEPRIYSSAMVEKGKPAPDLFLHAARSMAADPAASVVVEDSPVGIEAAKRAGMCVLAYVGGSHARPSGLWRMVEPLGPDVIFDDMRALPNLLADLSGG